MKRFKSNRAAIWSSIPFHNKAVTHIKKRRSRERRFFRWFRLVAVAAAAAIQTHQRGANVAAGAIVDVPARSARIDPPGVVQRDERVSILRIIRLRFIGAADAGMRLFIPALAQVDDPVEIVPLRVMNGNAVQYRPRGIEVVLVDYMILVDYNLGYPQNLMNHP